MLSSLEILVSSCEIPKGKKSRQNTENMTSLSSKCLVLNLKQWLTFEKRYYISKRTDYDWLYFVKLLLLSYQKRAEQNLRNEGEDRERKATVWEPHTYTLTQTTWCDSSYNCFMGIKTDARSPLTPYIPAPTCPSVLFCAARQTAMQRHSTALRLWGCCLPGA